MNILPIDRYGYDFIPSDYLPEGKDEYWLRDQQHTEQKKWRLLTEKETEILEKNANFCTNWGDFWVTDPFDPGLIRGSAFYGRIRLGTLQKALLRFHDFSIPAGIRNSTLISCDIGDECAIQDCSYISHYIIGGNCILSNINEMQTTNHAKFGNGVVRDGETEDVRVWIDVINEAGGRELLPFADMISADAYLWAAYRDDAALRERLREITQKQYGGYRGSYGTIGPCSVIKSCKIIKDMATGSCAYIKGANKLKNITVLSSADEPSQIGEGVELVNGIVGYGCHVFYGSKAVRFVMGRNSSLKYGARLIHSVLGDNSTVSCCEILNNLIFGFHEQHHNNSFLIASLVQGLSNMAAGATLGSNHNSRANDGELHAGRGFWPGLCVSLKHSSCFASYTIIAKGDYPSELNIPLPFSLVNNNVHKNRLEVLPAFFWMYNLYALERNTWKAGARDKRKIKVQHIETDYLAPDTAEEIIAALALLETWLVESSETGIGDKHIIPVKGLERGKREQVILKPVKAMKAYCRMLRYYAVKTLAAFLHESQEMDFEDLSELMGPEHYSLRTVKWVNMGGQIVSGARVDLLREKIRSRKLSTWQEIHDEYDKWDQEFLLDKARHAWAVLALLRDKGLEEPVVCDAGAFRAELERAVELRQWMSSQVLETRAKDFRNPFRKATFRSKSEMEQVSGTIETNKFITLTWEEEKRFALMIESITARL